MRDFTGSVRIVAIMRSSVLSASYNILCGTRRRFRAAVSKMGVVTFTYILADLCHAGATPIGSWLIRLRV